MEFDSKDKTIVIVSNKWDVHSHAVVDQIIDLGGNVVRINTEDLGGATFNVSPNQDQVELLLANGRILKKSEIHAGYLRRIMAPTSIPNVDPDYLAFCQREIQTIVFSLPYVLDSAKWLNSTYERMRASNKLHQLFIAGSAGLVIPDTLFSNDVQAIRSKSRCWGKSLFKAIDLPIGNTQDRSNTVVEIDPFCFTDIGEIPDAEDRIKTCPGQYQSYIDKEYELRIHIIGKKVIAVKIDSQSNARAKIDWRSQSYQLTYERYNLPSDLGAVILKFMSMMGLNLGVIDMIVTPSGEYVFLEVNPDGNWLWIEDFLPDIGITRSIASWLLAN